MFLLFFPRLNMFSIKTVFLPNLSLTSPCLINHLSLFPQIGKLSSGFETNSSSTIYLLWLLMYFLAGFPKQISHLLGRIQLLTFLLFPLPPLPPPRQMRRTQLGWLWCFLCHSTHKWPQTNVTQEEKRRKEKRWRRRCSKNNIGELQRHHCLVFSNVSTLPQENIPTCSVRKYVCMYILLGMYQFYTVRKF